MDNPVIGDGIKSFRYNCAKKMDVTHRRCNTHPHQYYIEMLNDVDAYKAFDDPAKDGLVKEFQFSDIT